MTHPAALTSAVLAAPGVRHGFFGRVGGVSTGIYASLNAGPGSDDDPAAVAENRARIAAAMGVAPERLTSAYQVHSGDALIVAAPLSGERPHLDALVTATPGLAVGVLTADCAPILLADAQAGVVGAAHAGWKGALAGIAEAAVAKMVELGASPERVVAAIGPCISQAAYEVGPEFVARFRDAEAANEAFFEPGEGDRARFDLKAYAAKRLGDAGVGRVDILPGCTYTDRDRWFSHRRSVHRDEADYGRDMAVIVLESG